GPPLRREADADDPGQAVRPAPDGRQPEHPGVHADVRGRADRAGAVHPAVQGDAAAAPRRRGRPRDVQRRRQRGGAMNLRERKLALLLLGVLILIGGVIIAYPTLYVPINERKDRIKVVRAEIDKANETVENVRKDQARWEKARTLSLPADVDLARGEYV